MAANRLNAPNQFETLAPPWILSQLDANSVQNQAAWNDSSLGFVNGMPPDTGSANAYLITLPLGVPSSYRSGMWLSFIPTNTNTGASAITVSPLGSVAIINPSGIALQGGEIAANCRLDLIYDGTAFRIVGPCQLSINAAPSSNSLTVECAGYSSVNVFSNFTNVAGLQLTLSHLAEGVPVSLVFVNSSGSNTSIVIIGTNPAGASFTSVVGYKAGSASGSSQFNLAAGITLNNGLVFAFNGGSQAALGVAFSF